ncbi:MAG TPA: type II secretion system protein N [Burkholderiaceae bacterium]
MVTTSQSNWAVRAATLIVWALAAASAVYWGLRMSAGPAAPPALVQATALAAPDAQALARLLGAGPKAEAAPRPGLASRFVLVGVLAGRASGSGAALIAIDGQRAKPFRVGAVVEDGLVLQALGPREARLGQAPTGPATLTLELPATATVAQPPIKG